MKSEGHAEASPCEQALAAWCERFPVSSSGRVAVAYSAGADSTALLLAAASRWPGRVTALHVHHGLQAAAHAFETHARAFSERHGVPLQVMHVDASHEPGQSPEDAARQARYAALADMAHSARAVCVLLGQHADDQAETLLLALSRGAGLPGLASMSERFERHGVAFGRPLLATPTATLRRWLLDHGHPFVEDPSNADERFTRNRIRAVLMPAWDACFPGFRPMLARSARHAAQAQRLLDELAAIDLARTGVPPAIDALQALSRDRQGNALRAWLKQEGVAASAAQLDELLDQIADCTTRGHGIRLKVALGLVSRQGAHLRYLPPLQPPTL
ncbi:MAG: tRNA lysidine(34) synthetase TilS [Hydrogenophaga sp.]|uniref:tRNA lysidine(34) synthetase TilS n=1 Tax=Hydrogenophaga sp. TaxID=1904254 RepID=UPI003D0974E6